MSAPLHSVTLENERAPHGKIHAICADCDYVGAWRRMRSEAEVDARAHNDAVRSCAHENFGSRVAVHRLVDDDGELTGFSADVVIRCEDCRTSFVFLGYPTGISLDEPATSVDGRELHTPIAPSFAWHGPGKMSTVRGFAVTRVDPGQRSDA